MANITYHLSPLFIIGSLYSCGNSLLNERLKIGGVTTWHDKSCNLYLNRLEFAIASKLVSVSLEFRFFSTPVINRYVRSLSPLLRSLNVRLGNIDTAFFKDETADFQEVFDPSFIYPSSDCPWTVRKSFPALELLHISGYNGNLNPVCAAQFLAGLPSSITDLYLPIFAGIEFDLYPFLPSQLSKLRRIGGRNWTAYPSSHHSLNSLEHLDLSIPTKPLCTYGLTRWHPIHDLSTLVLPRSLTSLILYCMNNLPDLNDLPSTLTSLELSSIASIQLSHPYEVLRQIPSSLTSFAADSLQLTDPDLLTMDMDSLKPFINLKRFHFHCDWNPPKAVENDFFCRLISLLPNVEDVKLFGILESHHLKLFNAEKLRALSVSQIGVSLEECRKLLPNVAEPSYIPLPSQEDDKQLIFSPNDRRPTGFWDSGRRKPCQVLVS